MKSNTLLAAEIVRRLPEFMRDGRENAETVIRHMLDEADADSANSDRLKRAEKIFGQTDAESVSLRDQFAMAAMSGLAKSQEMLLANKELMEEFGTAGIDKLQANKAYRLADAMIEQRKKI